MTRAVGGIGGILGEAPFLARGGLLIVWTTDPPGLARTLDRRFLLETAIAVPGADRKAIAVFRAA